MVDRYFHEYIRDVLGYSNLFYGSAESETPPYYVMFKVSDLEKRAVLCDIQGDTGEALFQFNAYAGGEGVAADAPTTLAYLYPLKNSVMGIKGIIGTSPNDYRIWSNNTTGVRIVNDGESTLGRWAAIFETTIRWEKL